MALNIKDEVAHRNARRLAALTGQSITAAVRDAIAARLRVVESERKAVTGKRRAAALLDAARACKAGLKPGGHSAGHAAVYGDDGLPV